MPEVRGPIEKGEKGWPINPLGVVALFAFTLIIIFLIVRPLLGQKSQVIDQNQQQISSGGKITTPQAGEIVRSNVLPIELAVDQPQNVHKIQFWAKTYADGKWQIIADVTSAPYKLEWQIPQSFQNKAIALTSHIYTKDGQIIKDPGGWREGIILLSP